MGSQCERETIKHLVGVSIDFDAHSAIAKNVNIREGICARGPEQRFCVNPKHASDNHREALLHAHLIGTRQNSFVATRDPDLQDLFPSQLGIPAIRTSNDQ